MALLPLARRGFSILQTAERGKEKTKQPKKKTEEEEWEQSQADGKAKRQLQSDRG